MPPERACRGLVLVLDDDPVMTELLSAMLGRSGFESATAGSRASAEPVLVERAQELVAAVCDLELPGESGLDVLRAVRVAAPAIVPVVMSGHPEERFRAQLGPGDADVVFFQKPFRPTDLVGAIESRL